MAVSDGKLEADDARNTRERLLDAAIHLAGREGRDRVTYRAVASRAGVAHSLVRHYFGTRERLLEEALGRASSMDAVEARIAASSIEGFASALVEVLNRDVDRAVLQFDSAVSGIRGQAAIGQVRRDYEHYIHAVSHTLESSGIRDDRGYLATVLFAALDGLALQHLIFGSSERTEEALTTLRDVMRMLADSDNPPR